MDVTGHAAIVTGAASGLGAATARALAAAGAKVALLDLNAEDAGTLADEIGAALLGQVPIEAAVANGGDIGEPIVLTSQGPAAQAFLAIAANIMNTTVPVTEMGGCTARDPEAVQVAISKRS